MRPLHLVAAAAATLTFAAGVPASHAGGTVFLNRDGATIKPATQDRPANNESVIITEQKTIAPWTDDAGFAALTACLTEKLASFDLDLVTTEPTSGDYHEMVLGGSPLDVGFPEGVGSVAPSACVKIPNLMLFVFTQAATPPSAAALCHNALFAIGVTANADAVKDPRDAMTYADTADVSYVDEELACGDSPRDCVCGGPTQNSYQLMRAAYGAAPAPEPEPEPEPEPGTGDQPADDLGADGLVGGCAAGGEASLPGLIVLVGAVAGARRRRR